jgi:3-hydroxybutyryl-CoA dehydrogenase
MHQIKKVCVCGAGTMGAGIAMVSAQAGFATIVFDLNEAVLDKAKLGIQKAWAGLVAKGKISEEDQEDFHNRMVYTTDILNCQANLVIEAIVEKLSAKISLFQQLEEINPINTIFASNTSSISIQQIAQELEHPSRFTGMHFFNPAPIMKLVEIVKGEETNDQVITLLEAICIKMGKTPVICKDSPGFIVNRVARHYYLESMQILQEGETDLAMIDKLLEASGFKMGPFKLMDLIGIDINYSVSEIVYNALGQPARLRPSPIQATKLAEGNLGKKTGKGFYEY